MALRINRAKTQFMKNAYCEEERIELHGSDIKETSSYVYLGRSMNMENNFVEEPWAAFGLLTEATDQLVDLDLRAHFFDSKVLPALCYAAETWMDTAATSKALRILHRVLERCLLRYKRRTQHQAGFRSSELRQMSLRDPAEYVLKARYRWAGRIMRREGDRWTGRTLEWIPREMKRPRRRSASTKKLAENSAENKSELLPTSSTMLMDDSRARTNQMETTLDPARQVTTGRLSV